MHSFQVLMSESTREYSYQDKLRALDIISTTWVIENDQKVDVLLHVINYLKKEFENNNNSSISNEDNESVNLLECTFKILLSLNSYILDTHLKDFIDLLRSSTNDTYRSSLLFFLTKLLLKLKSRKSSTTITNDEANLSILEVELFDTSLLNSSISSSLSNSGAKTNALTFLTLFCIRDIIEDPSINLSEHQSLVLTSISCLKLILSEKPFAGTSSMNDVPLNQLIEIFFESIIYAPDATLPIRNAAMRCLLQLPIFESFESELLSHLIPFLRITSNDSLLSSPSSPSSPPSASVIHSSSACDICDSVIHGVRYTCLALPDYDLCSTCFHAPQWPCEEADSRSFAAIRKDSSLTMISINALVELAKRPTLEIELPIFLGVIVDQLKYNPDKKVQRTCLFSMKTLLDLKQQSYVPGTDKSIIQLEYLTELLAEYKRRISLIKTANYLFDPTAKSVFISLFCLVVENSPNIPIATDLHALLAAEGISTTVNN